MSTTYKTRIGDTWEVVSARAYGVPTEITRLRAANPGLTDPFLFGETVNVPAYDEPVTSPVVNTTPTPAERAALELSEPITVRADSDEITVRIGEVWRNWSSIDVIRSADAVTTCEVTAPFDPNDPQQRADFAPFTYPAAQVQIGGRKLFTGSVVTVAPATTPAARTVRLGMYSLPGVLGDCSPSPDAPIEYRDAPIDEIARSLCQPFGVVVKFEEGVERGADFESVSIMPGDTVLGILAPLARQRGMIIGDDPSGALVFRSPTLDSDPVAVLREGERPLESVTVTYNGQSFFTSVTASAPDTPGAEGGTYTHNVDAPRRVFRPHSFAASNTAAGGAAVAARAEAGRMQRQAARWVVSVPTIRDPRGRVWWPGTTVKLTAPSVMLYSERILRIDRVVIECESETGAKTARLELVTPTE